MILAVIVYYHPEGNVLERFSSIFSQVDHVILYNNGDLGQINFIKDAISDNRCTIIEDGLNHGIADALNYARDYAINEGYEFLVTFDQDSQIESGFIKRIQRNLTADVGMIGPIYKDLNSGEESCFPVKYGPLVFRRRVSIDTNPVEVFCCITSGSICRTSVIKDVGPFRSDYFIDYVDNEYCLRIIKSGFKVLIDPHVCMYHALGNRTVVNGILKFTPTNYSAVRKYYMTRNRVDMYKNHFLHFPIFVAYDICAFLLDFFRVIAFESNKSVKVGSIRRGLIDGILGRMGKLNV